MQVCPEGLCPILKAHSLFSLPKRPQVWSLCPESLSFIQNNSEVSKGWTSSSAVPPAQARIPSLYLSYCDINRNVFARDETQVKYCEEDEFSPAI